MGRRVTALGGHNAGVQRHTADSLSPGQTACSRSGTYTESVTISITGTLDNPITFAASPGEVVPLTGHDTEWTGFVIDQGVSHVVLDGFRLDDCREVGVDIRGTNAYITLDPQFISMANSDFQLQSTSPVINAGVATGAPVLDLEGRPRDMHPDIGAYEWHPFRRPARYVPLIMQ